YDGCSSLCAVRRNTCKGSFVLQAAAQIRRCSFLDECKRGRGLYLPDGDLGAPRDVAAAAAAYDTPNPVRTGEIGRPAPALPYCFCVEYLVGAAGRKSAQAVFIEQIHRSSFAGGHIHIRKRTGLGW